MNIGGSTNMKIKVPNITFSNNKYLRDTLNKSFSDTTYNNKSIRFQGEKLIEF